MTHQQAGLDGRVLARVGVNQAADVLGRADVELGGAGEDVVVSLLRHTGNNLPGIVSIFRTARPRFVLSFSFFHDLNCITVLKLIFALQLRLWYHSFVTLNNDSLGAELPPFSKLVTITSGPKRPG